MFCFSSKFTIFNSFGFQSRGSLYVSTFIQNINVYADLSNFFDHADLYRISVDPTIIAISIVDQETWACEKHSFKVGRNRLFYWIVIKVQDDLLKRFVHCSFELFNNIDTFQTLRCFKMNVGWVFHDTFGSFESVVTMRVALNKYETFESFESI